LVALREAHGVDARGVRVAGEPPANVRTVDEEPDVAVRLLEDPERRAWGRALRGVEGPHRGLVLGRRARLRPLVDADDDPGDGASLERAAHAPHGRGARPRPRVARAPGAADRAARRAHDPAVHRSADRPGRVVRALRAEREPGDRAEDGRVERHRDETEAEAE